MLGTLLALLAAQSLQASPPPAAPPAAPEVRHGRMQIFIAPSGEPFRAPADTPYPVADWFARADANHDGKLTDAEFVADFMRFVATLDVNHDGVIDGQELERYENELAPELHTTVFAGNWGGGGDDSEGGGEDGDVGQNHRKVGSYMDADDPQGAGRFDLLRIPEPIASMDVELKGRIDRQAARDAAEYRFSLLDTQHRGYLLLADLPETFVQQHHNLSGHRGGRGGGHGGMGGGGHRRHGGGEGGGGGGFGGPE